MGYPHGMLSWADLSSTDQDGAEDYYRQLFGWEVEHNDIPGDGHYVMFSKDGKDVAGLGAAQPGMPSMWQAYVTVDDVDAAAARAKEAGGAVLAEPFDVMEAGRMTVVADPTGAAICAWEARSHDGAGHFNDPGYLSWAELATRDLPRARPFYEEVFGWTWEKAPVPGMEYWVASYQGQDPEAGGNAGAMEMDENFPPEVPAYWAVYFTVEDVDAFTERATELGGKVHVPPTDMAVGRFSFLEDPTGAMFYSIKMNP